MDPACQANAHRARSCAVTVVMTVRNDLDGCRTTLSSLAEQDRKPDEVIVVDGGSTDGTRAYVQGLTTALPCLRLIDAPGANIAQGRNIGTEAARHEIIVTTDAGCAAERSWLDRLVAPFEENPDVSFVAGHYRIAPETLLERVIGASTMRGCLSPIDPETFNPSARSMAYTRALWRRAGGWPDWIRFSEDTLWDRRVRKLGAVWADASDAVVAWRPRTSLRGLARQFFHYGTGRGHTQMGASNFKYNLRNFAAIFGCLIAGFAWPWFWAIGVALFCYFFGYAHHDRALRVAAWTGRKASYPLTLLVMWIVQVSHTTGYVVGTWHRLRDRDRYERKTRAYLAAP